MKKQLLVLASVFMILLLAGCPNIAGGGNGGGDGGNNGGSGTFTVSFDSNGGDYTGSFTVNYGEKITKPEDPRKQDWQFDGWYTEKTFQTKWDFNNNTVTKNVTLYAKWVERGNPGNVNSQLVGSWTFTDEENKVVLKINISSDGTATGIQLLTERSRYSLITVPNNNYFIDNKYLTIPKSVFGSYNQGKVVVTFYPTTTEISAQIITYQTNDLLPLGDNSINGTAIR